MKTGSQYEINFIEFNKIFSHSVCVKIHNRLIFHKIISFKGIGTISANNEYHGKSIKY
jgi:hypothetical protein